MTRRGHRLLDRAVQTAVAFVIHNLGWRLVRWMLDYDDDDFD